MSRFKAHLSRYHIVVIVLLFLGIGIYAAADWYWGSVCASGGCTIFFIDAYLAPLREAGLVFATVSLPFLFLPAHYFKKWFLYIFIPATLFTLWNLSIIDPNASHSFLPSTTRQSAMENYLIFWPAVTLLFIVYHWYRTQKST